MKALLLIPILFLTGCSVTGYVPSAGIGVTYQEYPEWYGVQDYPYWYTEGGHRSFYPGKRAAYRRFGYTHTEAARISLHAGS